MLPFLVFLSSFSSCIRHAPKVRSIISNINEAINQEWNLQPSLRSFENINNRMFSSMAFVQSTRRVRVFCTLKEIRLCLIIHVNLFIHFCIFTICRFSFFCTLLLLTYCTVSMCSKWKWKKRIYFEYYIDIKIYSWKIREGKNFRGENSFRVCRFFHFRFVAVINYTINVCTFK